MRNLPETGERVINTKKNSPLRQGASESSGLFSGKFLLYIQTKLVTDQYQFQQDHLGGLFMLSRRALLTK